MTEIPTSTRPITLPDETPEYSHVEAKLRKLAKAGYVILTETEASE